MFLLPGVVVDTRSVQRARFNAGFYKRLDASCSTFMRFAGFPQVFATDFIDAPASKTPSRRHPNANYVRYLRTYTEPLNARMPPCAKPDTSGLDGLRLAVILVFLSHSHVLAVDVGKLGVWTFFLISGFLIVGELHRNRQAVERHHDAPPRARAVPRETRAADLSCLLPAARRVAIAHALFYQRGVNLSCGTRRSCRIIDRRRQDGWPGSTSHFWSLAVEQQFYLIAPLALLGARRATRRARHRAIVLARSRISRSTSATRRRC